VQFDPSIIKKYIYNDPKTSRNEIGKVEKFLKLKQAISENWFFEVYNLNNLEGSLWQEVILGFSASNFQILNDSSDVVLFSWEGNNIDGILNSSESLSFNQLEREKIYLKSKGKIRLWAY
jgi:hypothetical protein